MQKEIEQAPTRSIAVRSLTLLGKVYAPKNSTAIQTRIRFAPRGLFAPPPPVCNPQSTPPATPSRRWALFLGVARAPTGPGAARPPLATSPSWASVEGAWAGRPTRRLSLTCVSSAEERIEWESAACRGLRQGDKEGGGGLVQPKDGQVIFLFPCGPPRPTQTLFAPWPRPPIISSAVDRSIEGRSAAPPGCSRSPPPIDRSPPRAIIAQRGVRASQRCSRRQGAGLGWAVAGRATAPAAAPDPESTVDCHTSSSHRPIPSTPYPPTGTGRHARWGIAATGFGS